LAARLERHQVSGRISISAPFRVDGLIALHPIMHGSRGRPKRHVSDVLRGALVLALAALDSLVVDSVVEAVPALARKGSLGKAAAKRVKDESEAVLACFAAEDPARPYLRCIASN
jgi:hypothetical protein